MRWPFRRSASAAADRAQSEYERVAARIAELRANEDLSTAVTDVDTASPTTSSGEAGPHCPPGALPCTAADAAPVEPSAPSAPRPLPSGFPAGAASTSDDWPGLVVTCECGRVMPCRHWPHT